MRKECKSLQDFCDYNVLNPLIFYENVCFVDGRIKSKNWRNFRINKVEMELTYKQNCSNSHGAPKEEKINWHRKTELPTSFPGYYGRLYFKTNQPVPFFTSKLFDIDDISCGSGGGTHRSYSCDITLWVQDWPGLKSSLNSELNEIMIDKLTDNLRGIKMKTHKLFAYAEIEDR